MQTQRAVVSGDIRSVAAYAGSVIGAVNRAGAVVVVRESAFIVDAGNSAVMGNGSKVGTKDFVARQRAFVVARDTANILTSIRIIGASTDGYFADAIRYCTLVVAYYTTVPLECIAVCINSHSARDVAVRNGCTSFGIACNSTHLLLTGDTGIADSEVFDIGIRAKSVKKAFLLRKVVVGVDTEAADGMAVAVEMAVKFGNSGEVALCC